MKTPKTLTGYLLFFTILFVFTSCQKELVFEDQPNPPDNTGSTPAVYTLGGAGSNCTGAVLSGTYMSGVATTETNTVKIQVTVTTKGSYSLSTASVNGIKFTGKGDFSNTGEQTITLTATGTPEADGDKTFSITGANSNCSFVIKFLAAAPPAVFSLAGSPNACTSPAINGTYAVGSALSSNNSIVLKVNVTAAGTYSITTNTVNGISFSGSGVFTSTGNNIAVTLTGSGTPAQKGVTTLKPNVTAACSFDITVTDAPPAGSGTYSCKIDGTLTTFNEHAVFAIKSPLDNKPYLKLEGYRDDKYESQFQIFILNNDNSPVKAGTYDEKHFAPTSLTDLGYRIEVDYTVKNADLSTTTWNTSSSIAGFSVNPPFTIIVTSITATRVKGTFSGKLTDIPNATKTKVITEGVFDLPLE